MAQVPLAENCGCVAARFQHLGDCLFGVADPNFARRPQGPEDANAIWVTAGKQGGSRRGTNRLRDIEVGEPYALSGHAVQVWCADVLCPVTTKVAITQVVGVDDDNIRR